MRRADPDLWGYLTYGRLFVEMGGPVEWDPFSYTCARCTWIYFEYLSQISLWLAYSVALLTVGAVAWHRRGLLLGIRPGQWLAASTPLALLTVLSVRHLPILVIWISPVLVLLSGHMPALPKGWLRRFWTAQSECLAIPAVLTLAVVIHNPAVSIGIPEGTLGKTEPFGAVAFIRESGLAGNLYLPLWWGSYATWELYPRIRVAIDGRNVSLYPPDMVKANMEFYVRDDGDLDQPLRCASHYLLVPSDAPVLARLAGDSRWRRIFEDPDCVLFVRADVVRERIPRELAERPVVRATTWRRRMLT